METLSDPSFGRIAKLGDPYELSNTILLFSIVREFSRQNYFKLDLFNSI